MKPYFPFLGLALLLTLPLANPSPATMHLIILIILWSTMGMAWNLLGGFCGQISFGHATFFGIGAYTAGILYTKWGLSSWWGIPASTVVIFLFAMVIGHICLRLRGPSFALATIAINVIVRIVAENWIDLTGGDLGMMIRERTWLEKTGYYYIILALATGTFLLIKTLMASKSGYYFMAIREDQDTAESLGIHTTFYKTLAFTLSAIFTGFAGAFYMNYMGYIDPKVVFALYDISVLTIMVVVVGGVATFWGPIIGSIMMVLFSEFIRSFPELAAAHQILFGILLIVVILFLPNGIMGSFKRGSTWGFSK